MRLIPEIYSEAKRLADGMGHVRAPEKKSLTEAAG